MDISHIVMTVTKRYPGIIPHLKGKARWIAYAYQPHAHETKTVDFYLRTMQGLIRSLYNGDIGGEFIDIMANLISGQLRQAYISGAADAGLLEIELTGEMENELQGFILAEFDYVDNIFRDIINARIDETTIDPLLARAKLWANRWNEVYNSAKHAVMLAFGGKEMWVIGATEDHCISCMPLNGIVAFASEWEASGFKPQGKMLDCGGWNCKCELIPTNARRSNKPAERLAKIPRK